MNLHFAYLLVYVRLENLHWVMFTCVVDLLCVQLFVCFVVLLCAGCEWNP